MEGHQDAGAKGSPLLGVLASSRQSQIKTPLTAENTKNIENRDWPDTQLTEQQQEPMLIVFHAVSDDKRLKTEQLVRKNAKVRALIPLTQIFLHCLQSESAL